MSTCPDPDLFSAYVDGEVPSPWKEKIEAHIHSCVECTERTERYFRLHQLVAQSNTEPALDLDESFTRLMERRSSRVAVQKTRSHAWIHSSIKLPVPAMAALFIFALMIPAWFSFRAGMQTTHEQQLFAANTTSFSGLASQRQGVLRLPVSDAALISTDFPANDHTYSFVDTAKPLFTVVNYSRQFYPDSEMFDDAEIVIIRLPNLTRFNSDDQYLFDGESLIPVGFLEK